MTDVQNYSPPKLARGRLFDPAHRCHINLTFFENTKGEIVRYFHPLGVSQANYCLNVELSDCGFSHKQAVYIHLFDSRLNPPKSEVSIERYLVGTLITKFVDFSEIINRQNDIDFVKRYCLNEMYDCLKLVSAHNKFDTSAIHNAYQRCLANNIELDKPVMISKRSPNGLRSAQLHYLYRDEIAEFRIVISNLADSYERTLTFLKVRAPMADWATYQYCSKIVWVGNSFLRLDGRGSGINIYIPVDGGEIDFSVFERWFVPERFPERGEIRHLDSIAHLRPSITPHSWVRLRTKNDVELGRVVETFGKEKLTAADLQL